MSLPGRVIAPGTWPVLGVPATQNVARRRFLKASLALGAAALGGCAIDRLRVAPTSVRRDVSTLPFARPVIDAADVIAVKVGLRPYRRGGFVVRGERLGDQVLVHNYGHGGAGITLSWGSSTLAADLAPDLIDKRAAVIGAGVMGLSTARLLQQRGWRVTIYTREAPADTTSGVAGGHWAPTGVGQLADDDRRPLPQLDRALAISHAFFAERAGRLPEVYWREGYHLSNHAFGDDDPFYAKLWPQYFRNRRFLTPDEHPFLADYVQVYTSLMIEPQAWLARLLGEFREAGGTLVMREIATTAELATLAERVIFNCTGLGAKALFNDAELTPVRGQLVHLKPDLRLDYDTHGIGGAGGIGGIGGNEGLFYMFPRRDALVLGGSFERGNASREIDPAQTERILAGHAAMARGMRMAG